jgi:hypothetical protein
MKERHDELREEVKKDHKRILDLLELTFEMERQTCDHEWEHVDDLFCMYGDAHPGDKCHRCGSTRHKPKPKKGLMDRIFRRE